MSIDLSSMPGNYPLANSLATRMLHEAFEKINEEKGMSQRQIAPLLGYKSSVTLSHMAIGRVPIPIDRAVDFARFLGMDPGEFLIAVLEQRYPELNVRRVLGALSKHGKATVSKTPVSVLVAELESIAGQSLDGLPVQTINVLREAVSDKNAPRRWMNMGEVPIIENLRRAKPHGLTPADVKKLNDFIESL